MKQFIYIPFLFCLMACKKEITGCKDYIEVKGSVKTVDVSTIDFQPFRDTLAKYPQLVPVDYVNTAYNKWMTCEVYYQNLPVFFGNVSFSKYATHDTIRQSGAFLKGPLTISIQPKITYKNAIENARQYSNFDYSCIHYQLGLYNTNYYTGVKTADYRLVWKIMDSEKSYVYVISDAQTNRVYYAYPGRYWAY